MPNSFAAWALAMVLLCNSNDTTLVRVYSPFSSVSTLVEEVKADKIYANLVKIVQRDSSLDMNDPMTAYFIKYMGYDEALKRQVSLRYVDSAGVRVNFGVGRTTEHFQIPTQILIIIGYGRDPQPREKLVSKTLEMTSALKSLCEDADAQCSVITKNLGP